MGSKLDLEYYPELSEKAIQDSVNKIKNNLNQWQMKIKTLKSSANFQFHGRPLDITVYLYRLK